jgi:hypothetical protein
MIYFNLAYSQVYHTQPKTDQQAVLKWIDSIAKSFNINSVFVKVMRYACHFNRLSRHQAFF